MISYGQKRLNKADVQKGTRNFIFSFLILCAMAFGVVFLFFKSAEMQKKQIRSDVEAYNDLIKRNELLYVKLDDIYDKMYQMSDENVDNDVFYITSIKKDIGISNDLIDTDSTADLKQISLLLKQMEPMLSYKSELLKKKIEKNNMERLLRQCLGNDSKVTEKIVKKSKPKGKLY